MKKQKSSNNIKNLLPKVLIGAALIAVVVLLAVFLKPTGQAYTTPPVGPLDLNVTESVSVSIKHVPSWDIAITPSGTNLQSEYHIDIVPLDDSASPAMVKYSISQGVITFLEGLLGDELESSGNLYLDFDTVPDIELSYNDGEITVRNIVYEQPTSAVITLLDLEGTLINTVLSDIPSGEAVERYVKVESSTAASVTAYWDDGTPLTEGEFYVNNTVNGTAGFTIMNLTFTPPDDSVNTITVVSDVDGEVTEKDFIFSVGGVVATLSEANFPLMTLSKVVSGAQDIYTVTFNFTGGLDMQAFSPPCDVGEIMLGSDEFTDSVKGVYSWNEDNQKWARRIPDVWNRVWDFGSLQQDRGYYIRLKSGVNTFSFTEECNDFFTESNNPFDDLVNVKEGWNLVGIPGYERMSVEELNVDEGLEVVEIHVIKDDDVKESGITMMEPGKAYWVLVE